VHAILRNCFVQNAEITNVKCVLVQEFIQVCPT